MKYVIVTGAAGGIGQAMVGAFIEAGHEVVAVDVADEVLERRGQHYVQCDLARTVNDQAYADEVFGQIRRLMQRHELVALVNNAAVQVLGPAENLHRDAWRCTLDVNLLAPFFWAQAFLGELERAKGCVLNVSSIHARLTKPGFIAYATSKAALSGLTRAMAVELGARIRVNAIEPAAISTPMLRAGFAGDAVGYQRLAEYHPAGEIGSPDALAKFVMAVVGQEGAFLNGAVLSFDGAISAKLHDPGESA